MLRMNKLLMHNNNNYYYYYHYYYYYYYYNICKYKQLCARKNVKWRFWLTKWVWSPVTRTVDIFCWYILATQTLCSIGIAADHVRWPVVNHAGLETIPEVLRWVSQLFTGRRRGYADFNKTLTEPFYQNWFT